MIVYGWQLDHGRRLTFTQAGQEDDLAIRQFKRVVMHRSAPDVHLLESGQRCPELFRAQPEPARDGDLAIERNRRSGLEANSNIGLTNCTEPAR